MSDTAPPPDSDLPSSWDEEDHDALRADAKSRRWWWIGGAALLIVVALVAVLVVANRASDPEERAWPDAVGGRPEGLGGENETAAQVTPSADPGVYIWQSFDGWHLWVVSGDGLDGLTGTITSNEDIVSARSSDEDAGTATLDGKEITFDLDAGAPLAGVDFDPGFSRELTFRLETADGEVSADQVFTGSGKTPADAVPVVIDKPVVD